MIAFAYALDKQTLQRLNWRTIKVRCVIGEGEICGAKVIINIVTILYRTVNSFISLVK